MLGIESPTQFSYVTVYHSLLGMGSGSSNGESEVIVDYTAL